MNRHRPAAVSSLAALACLLAIGAVGAAPRHPAAAKHPAPAAPAKQASPEHPNDFPTQARVEYVMQCMAERGGQNLDRMYHCVCAVDRIAGLMKFNDYSEALTFTYMFDTPGDKGGEFRDPPRSKELRDQLKEAKKAAEGCFPEAPSKTQGGKP